MPLLTDTGDASLARHPAQLKNAVESPGGTTIAGVDEVDEAVRKF